VGLEKIVVSMSTLKCLILLAKPWMDERDWYQSLDQSPGELLKRERIPNREPVNRSKAVAWTGCELPESIGVVPCQ